MKPSAMNQSSLRFLDVTLPTPEENLACDEALLEACEARTLPGLLRVWEPQTHFVVLGYANALRQHVNLAACRRARIPVLRRISGGGSVLQGPGCLNFSLILPHDGTGPLASLRGTTAYVLHRHQDALQPLLGRAVRVEGTSDLAVASRKFSGNAQRRAGRSVLFHGTFLLDLDLTLVQQVLRQPPAQPAYRQGRTHADFLTNLGVPAARLVDILRASWNATRPLGALPRDAIQRLVQRRYGAPAWVRCR
jgi:lipoate-protein ligase A